MSEEIDSPGQQTLTIQQAIDLGVEHQNAGRLPEAESIYQQILQADPNQPVALHLLGVIASQVGKNDIAVDLITKALAIKPDFADAHGNLGISLKALGRLNEAVAHCQKAINLKPDFADAHCNLGVTLQELGRLDEAVAHFNKAIDIKPDYAMAHSNLGAALKKLGRLDEAVAHSQKAIEIMPDFADAHKNMGLQLTALGRFSEAKVVLDKGFRINHGGGWWNALTFADGHRLSVVPTVKKIISSTFRLRDNVDQLEHLIAKNKLDPSFHHMVDRYKAVLTEIQQQENGAAVIQLTAGQSELLGSFFDRVVHYADVPRIGTGSVNESLDFKQIEDKYFSSSTSVTQIDEFLTPQALRALRDFCLESTIYFAYNSNYFVGSKSTSGFNCDLLYQIAEELKERFPRVLGNHQLADMWIYRHQNQSMGVAAHTDEAAVTFNFWITPDEANLMPKRGGLIVYAKEFPDNWDMRYYNINKNHPSVSREIADFLTDADSVVVPYRENRALLFRSNLFHKSDKINFRDGFENRRMNITLVFGTRPT
jgi:Flp pilus assembly protein TadD